MHERSEDEREKAPDSAARLQPNSSRRAEKNTPKENWAP
jgi:hypothetical protein